MRILAACTTRLHCHGACRSRAHRQIARGHQPGQRRDCDARSGNRQSARHCRQHRAELGRRLDVPVEYVVFEQARNAVDAMQAGTIDVVFVAIEPVRAAVIDFTAPYAEIAGTYAVPPGSKIRTMDEIDRTGVRISVVARSNYDLFLTRTLKNAQLVRANTTQGSADEFVAGKVDALAGVKQRVDDAVARTPGARVLDGRFMSIRQAIGMSKGRPAGLAYLAAFVEDIKASGLVAREIEAEGLRDASVAPPARGQ
jgi:polar amino acid transport system substrate-binding protein